MKMITPRGAVLTTIAGVILYLGSTTTKRDPFSAEAQRSNKCEAYIKRNFPAEYAKKIKNTPRNDVPWVEFMDSLAKANKVMIK